MIINNSKVENTNLKKSDVASLYSSQVGLLLFYNGQYNQFRITDNDDIFETN